ncbi:MAG TPA: response regulator transcription factor [Jatrophihabitantaceae bacterium]|jgi:DNA-binding response OmpR family regulator|nr:response regulator transcription factor [Jatrophihabitantaceae bacterium]
MNRILIVDDDADIRDLLAFAMRRHRYETIVAADGVAALEAVEQVTPDVVLIDWVMPRMGGLGVCEELRSRARFDYTGIFLITANTDAGDQLLALAAGANDYICKPFKISDVVARVGTFLTSRSAAAPLIRAS